MKKTPEYNSSDAWLLLAVIYAGPEGATLERIIEVGDGIEHAIFNPEELESGLARLTAGGHLQEKAGVFFATSGVMTGYQKTTSPRRSIQKEPSDIERYLGAASPPARLRGLARARVARPPLPEVPALTSIIAWLR